MSYEELMQLNKLLEELEELQMDRTNDIAEKKDEIRLYIDRLEEVVR